MGLGALVRSFLVLELPPEYLQLEFQRVGAQVFEGRVFDELGGGLWNGRVAGLGESLDDRRLAGAGAAGDHDKFCCH